MKLMKNIFISFLWLIWIIAFLSSSLFSLGIFGESITLYGIAGLLISGYVFIFTLNYE